MFAVCDTTAPSSFTNGAANGSAPGCLPSRNRIIAAMPPFRRATSAYSAPASSSSRRTNSPRPWIVGQ